MTTCTVGISKPLWRNYLEKIIEQGKTNPGVCRSEIYQKDLKINVLKSTTVIIPGSYICGYEDLEDIGLELGKVRKPLFLYYTKAMRI